MTATLRGDCAITDPYWRSSPAQRLLTPPAASADASTWDDDDFTLSLITKNTKPPEQQPDHAGTLESSHVQRQASRVRERAVGGGARVGSCAARCCLRCSPRGR